MALGKRGYPKCLDRPGSEWGPDCSRIVFEWLQETGQMPDGENRRPRLLIFAHHCPSYSFTPPSGRAVYRVL